MIMMMSVQSRPAFSVIVLMAMLVPVCGCRKKPSPTFNEAEDRASLRGQFEGNIRAMREKDDPTSYFKDYYVPGMQRGIQVLTDTPAGEPVLPELLLAIATKESDLAHLDMTWIETADEVSGFRLSNENGIIRDFLLSANWMSRFNPATCGTHYRHGVCYVRFSDDQAPEVEHQAGNTEEDQPIIRVPREAFSGPLKVVLLYRKGKSSAPRDVWFVYPPVGLRQASTSKETEMK